MIAPSQFSEPTARRGFVVRALSLLALPFARASLANAANAANAEVESIVPAIRELTHGAPIASGRVRLELPRLAENGNSVALRVSVSGAMHPGDFVKAIHLFSEKNPRPVIARFFLGPRAGRAEISTRIRVAGTQRIVAVAELSDGSFQADTAEVAVTLSACFDGS